MPFRAVHAETGDDHVLWDETPGETVEAWRELARRRLLLCPVCEAPMRVRAGERYATHFAHFHRVDCPTLDDTAELRAARLAVYQWLRPKVEARGGTVTIEDWVRDAGLPRPVDVHVRFDDGKPGIAVWLHDRQLRPERREALERTLLGLPAVPRWLFVERMLRPVGGVEGGINLSTLERDRGERTPFDELGGGAGSLHYLVEENTAVRTYRGLTLVHAPGTFTGLVREDPLSAVMLTRRGALVHPGEPEALAARRAGAGERREDLMPTWNAGGRPGGARPLSSSPHRSAPLRSPTLDVPYQPGEAECSVCGEVRRWVMRDGATGQTKCSRCVGKDSPSNRERD